jgi:hypothetical protein
MRRYVALIVLALLFAARLGTGSQRQTADGDVAALPAVGCR